MGMDVFGRAPENEDGDYFRANTQSWYPILDLIKQTGVLSEQMTEEMGYNDGAGPEDGEQAKALADALEVLLGNTADENEFISPDAHENDGTAAVFLTVHRMLTGEDTAAPVFSTRASHIREFIRFCRASGGFAVC
jgi:hypothetical protein